MSDVSSSAISWHSSLSILTTASDAGPCSFLRQFVSPWLFRSRRSSESEAVLPLFAYSLFGADTCVCVRVCMCTCTRARLCSAVKIILFMTISNYVIHSAEQIEVRLATRPSAFRAGGCGHARLLCVVVCIPVRVGSLNVPCCLRPCLINMHYAGRNKKKSGDK